MAGSARPNPTLARTVAIGLTTALAATVMVETAADGSAPAGQQPSVDSTDRGRAEPLFPDLTPLRAVDVSITKSAGVRAIRFEAGLASIGKAPIEVRPDRRQSCPRGKRHASQIVYRDLDGNGRFRRSVDTAFNRRSAGCMVFHPTHNHWHFQAASRYAIYKAGRPGSTIKHARKMSFCLRDSKRTPPRYGRFNSPLYYRECGRDTPQGISRGWVDVYASYLSGQSIVIPPRVDGGIFCLSIRVDPLDRLKETDERNNRSVRALHIHGTRVSYAKQKHCR